MTTLIVEFSRNESQVEGERIVSIECEEFVQVTYDEIRIGPEGDPIAQYMGNVGHWRKYDEPSEFYTDITIWAKGGS